MTKIVMNIPVLIDIDSSKLLSNINESNIGIPMYQKMAAKIFLNDTNKIDYTLLDLGADQSLLNNYITDKHINSAYYNINYLSNARHTTKKTEILSKEDIVEYWLKVTLNTDYGKLSLCREIKNKLNVNLKVAKYITDYIVHNKSVIIKSEVKLLYNNKHII